MMEQDFLVFDEEDRRKKTRQEKHLFWERWLLSKGFYKHHDSYFTKSVRERDLDRDIYMNGEREVAEIHAELNVGIVYLWFSMNRYCLDYYNGFEKTEISGSFHTIDAISNGIKEYLDLRDELIKLQEQVGDE